MITVLSPIKCSSWTDVEEQKKYIVGCIAFKHSTIKFQYKQILNKSQRKIRNTNNSAAWKYLELNQIESIPSCNKKKKSHSYRIIAMKNEKSNWRQKNKIFHYGYSLSRTNTLATFQRCAFSRSFSIILLKCDCSSSLFCVLGTLTYVSRNLLFWFFFLCIIKLTQPQVLHTKQWYTSNLTHVSIIYNFTSCSDVWTVGYGIR